MVEKIGTIKNPLTIIAIFAGIAEVSASAVLPFIGDDVQQLFVWFVMAFPCALVLLFFFTLNFNHAVLYAPSDYQDEDNFVKSLPRASFEEKIKKIEATAGLTPLQHPGALTNVEAVSSKAGRLQTNLAVQQLYAEDMVIRLLEREYKVSIQQDARVGEYTVDGIIKRSKHVTIVEIETSKAPLSVEQARAIVGRLEGVVARFPQKLRFQFDFLLVLVLDGAAGAQALTEEAVEYLQSATGPAYPVAFRVFPLAQLLSPPEF